MNYKEEVRFFNGIVDNMKEVFARKRNDYGATTTETFRRFGPVSMLTRMYDKLGRIENLTLKHTDTTVCDESVEDTLLDLANYAIIMILEINKSRSNERGVKM